MKSTDPLAEKRKKLARLIAAKNQAKLKALGESPFLDFDTSVFERHSDFETVLRGFRNADESALDELIAYHDPAGSGQYRYVW